MARDFFYQHCPNCDQVQPHNTTKVNHILHLLLTIFTAGLWLIVWLGVSVTFGKRKATCAGCGFTPRTARRVVRREDRREKKLQQKREREAAETALPFRGQRVKVVNGPHKGKLGTAASVEEGIVTIADKANRTIEVDASMVRNVL